MFSNLPFGLTTFAYIALTIFNLQKVTATGERLVGWGIIAFAILAVYVVCSLFLTISVTSKGGFNWLSDTVSLRNIAVAVLWLGMMTGVVYCTMIRMELHTDPSTGVMRWLTLPMYFGAVWLPLLMLAPYAILLHPEWRDTFSPNLYKIPLALGGIIGLAVYMASNLLVRPADQDPLDKSKWSYEHAIDIINRYNDPGRWEFTSRGVDERVRRLALAKTKEDGQWETDMLQALESNQGYLGVYAYLDGNTLDHPERFIGPIKSNIYQFAYEIGASIQATHRSEEYFRYLDAERLCRVLDEHFKDSSAVFRPAILELQKALEKEPLDRFVETRNQYRRVVKNWLDTNR